MNEGQIEKGLGAMGKDLRKKAIASCNITLSRYYRL